MDSVSKKPIIGGIILAAIIGVVFVVAHTAHTLDVGTPDNPENEEVVFHVTLADPSQYTCNPQVIAYTCDDQWREYRDSENLEKGEYMFRFVANGDSPEVLTVNIRTLDYGAEYSSVFFRTFTLKGIPHESETSLYYTWDYDGQKKFSILEADIWRNPEYIGEGGLFRITINPNGNLMGPVSVDLIKLR